MALYGQPFFPPWLAPWDAGITACLPAAGPQALPCLTPCHRAAPAHGNVSPAGSLLILAPLVWFHRISQAMLKWACWILTDREVDS